jgi:16S rRNA processing protein RimM
LKAQGRRGEVAVELHSSLPDRIQAGMGLSGLAVDGARRPLKVEEAWPHKGLLVVKFAGIDSISAAQTLAGCELQVPKEERAQLDPGWTFVSDLIGCTVFDGNHEIGRVEDVQFGGGEAPLLLVKAGVKEFEIPYAQAFVKSVDTAGRQVRMVLPEGMLEVNAPLTAEEKQEQCGGRNRAK